MFAADGPRDKVWRPQRTRYASHGRRAAAPGGWVRACSDWALHQQPGALAFVRVWGRSARTAAWAASESYDDDDDSDHDDDDDDDIAFLSLYQYAAAVYYVTEY
jgi:hypothetical protein